MSFYQGSCLDLNEWEIIYFLTMARKMPEGLRKYLEKKGKLKSEDSEDDDDKIQKRKEALSKSKKAKSKLEEEKRAKS